MDITHERALDYAYYRFKPVQHRCITTIREYPYTLPYLPSANVSFPLQQNAVLNYLADAYPTYPASFLAGNDFIHSIFSAGFPLFARAMYINLGVGWASTLLALLSCAFVPIPILLYEYGEHIRMASKHVHHDFE